MLEQVVRMTNSLAHQVSVLIWNRGKLKLEWNTYGNKFRKNQDHTYKKQNHFRCDVKADCDDESDEVSCQIVHLKAGYLKESTFFVTFLVF